MLPASASDLLKTRVAQLVGKRKPLSEQFEKNPNDTHLAVELKLIDDQIADCNQQIQGNKTKRKSPPDSSSL